MVRERWSMSRPVVEHALVGQGSEENCLELIMLIIVDIVSIFLYFYG